MVLPRFFHKMSLLQLPRLVKRGFFKVGFGQWTPQGVQWILYRGWRVNIGRVKSQCTTPGCYNNAFYFISVQSNTVQYSTMQRGYCCAVQLSAFQFSLRKRNLVSVLLSAKGQEIKRLQYAGFFLEIGVMKQHIFY